MESEDCTQVHVILVTLSNDECLAKSGWPTGTIKYSFGGSQRSGSSAGGTSKHTKL